MRALLVTHGALGEELLRCARSIYAVDAPIDALSNHDLDAVTLRRRVGEWLGERDDSALLMVDVGGGSCGIAARAAAAGRARTWVLGGVNLAMVLTFLSGHGQVDDDDLVSKILDRALNAVRLLGDER